MATLTNVFLTFSDPDVSVTYEREKIIHYSKLMPVITLTCLMGTLALEVLKRGPNNSSTHTILTTYVNIFAILACLVMSIAVRYKHSVSWFICPVLTLVSFYYVTVVDLEDSNIATRFTLAIGVTLAFLLLCLFNEVWLISTATYAPLITYFLWLEGSDMDGPEDNSSLAVRCFFCIILYGVVAYKVEQLKKMAFIGRQSGDKAFYKWLSVFETFPEGIALIRDG